jgi:pilus assembly protein CpaF
MMKIHQPTADVELATVGERQQTREFRELLEAAETYVRARIEDRYLDLQAWSREAVRHYLQAEARSFVSDWRIRVDAEGIQLIGAALINEILGLGPLESLLADASVEDILVDGPERVMLTRTGGVPTNAGIRFNNELHLLRTIRKLLAPLGLCVDERHPLIEVRLPDGAELTVAVAPVSAGAPLLSIHRGHIRPLTPNELQQLAPYDPLSMELLATAVRRRQNLLVTGAAGTGKTAMASFLAGHIPPGERILTLESRRGLDLAQDDTIRLVAAGNIDPVNLLRIGLRMRPDRLVVDLGAALCAPLWAGMGREGFACIASKEARSPQAALAELGEAAKAFDLVAHLVRLATGRCLVAAIVEVNNHETARPLFLHPELPGSALPDFA